jgi:hypothetical protein
MKNIFLRQINIIFLFIALLACTEKSNKIIIQPLHPYRSTPADYRVNEIVENSFVNKFFFIDNSANQTLTFEKVKIFVQNFVHHDSDYKKFGDYHLYFYRQTSTINENYRENIDGMISNVSLDDFDENLIFKFTWIDLKFSGCEFFYKGKIIEVKRKIEGDVFKDTTIVDHANDRELMIERKKEN